MHSKGFSMAGVLNRQPLLVTTRKAVSSEIAITKAVVFESFNLTASEKVSFPACETADCAPVRLEANIGSINEAQGAIDNGAEGIGLLRTEPFYMSFSHTPSVEEEYDFYATMMSIIKKLPITIRLLDLGADKYPSYVSMFDEENPQLGIRGIRYLLRSPDLFQKHLRSLIRASAISPIKICIPFVTTLRDVHGTLENIDELCRREKVDRAGIRVGIMVEIPSVALSIDSFLPAIDFLIIGADELVQYVFAAGKKDDSVDEYRQNIHPVILRMLKNILDKAWRHGKEATLCGEIAGQPELAPLLVGLGVRSFSMQPSSITTARNAIGKYSCKEMKKIAGNALQSRSMEQVRKLLYPIG